MTVVLCCQSVPLKPMWGSEVPTPIGNQEAAREKARKATENKNFMKLGLQKYVGYWKTRISKCEGFAAAFGPYVDYWKGVLSELNKPLLATPSELAEGFWPQHDWRVPRDGVPHLGGLVLMPSDVTPEDEEPEPYCGPRNATPLSGFNPWRDIRKGSWVLMRPSDPRIYPVWQGRAASDVCRQEGNENHKKFLIQYWEPRNGEKNMKKKYLNCWDGQWIQERRVPEWITVDCVLFATWSKIPDPKMRTIPRACKDAAIENLNKANEIDP